MQKIFGLAGYAGCGKDTFYQVSKSILAKNNIIAERLALADPLKENMRDFILDKCKIDILTCSRTEKDVIRPLLVAYGKVMRKLSNGRYWVELTDKLVKKSKADVIFITDLRYDVYKNDEYIASIGDKRFYDYPTYLINNGKQYADERRKLYYI